MCKTLSTQTSQRAAGQQTYRFEFGSDDRIFSTSFRGALTEPEIRGILESVRNSLYEKCGDAIRAYLDSHNLTYSKFTVKEKLIQVTKPITFADSFLHDPSCDIVDKWIGGTKYYFCVMDCRDWMEDHCKGCYFVLARFPSEQNGQYEYHVISQTFDHTGFREKEESHFAIRKDDGEHNLVTLDEDDTSPVLETFGCVDLLSLLCNITNFTKAQQAGDLANK